MDEVEQIFAPGGAIEAFEAAKKAGKCRFIGFTGHHDPEVHLAMLKNYDKYDTILMPLNPADPSYLSFEKMVLPVAVERGMGIQGMKSTANAGLLSEIHLKDCLTYVLSLPIHCLALGCTTIGQIEDDVRIAQQFKPMSQEEMAQVRETVPAWRVRVWKTGSAISTPRLPRLATATESWLKRVREATPGDSERISVRCSTGPALRTKPTSSTRSRQVARRSPGGSCGCATCNRC